MLCPRTRHAPPSDAAILPATAGQACSFGRLAGACGAARLAATRTRTWGSQSYPNPTCGPAHAAPRQVRELVLPRTARLLASAWNPASRRQARAAAAVLQDAAAYVPPEDTALQARALIGKCITQEKSSVTSNNCTKLSNNACAAALAPRHVTARGAAGRREERSGGRRGAGGVGWTAWLPSKALEPARGLAGNSKCCSMLRLREGGGGLDVLPPPAQLPAHRPMHQGYGVIWVRVRVGSEAPHQHHCAGGAGGGAGAAGGGGGRAAHAALATGRGGRLAGSRRAARAALWQGAAPAACAGLLRGRARARAAGRPRARAPPAPAGAPACSASERGRLHSHARQYECRAWPCVPAACHHVRVSGMWVCCSAVAPACMPADHARAPLPPWRCYDLARPPASAPGAVRFTRTRHSSCAELFCA